MYLLLPAMTNPLYIQYLSQVIIPLTQQSVYVRIATWYFASVKSDIWLWQCFLQSLALPTVIRERNIWNRAGPSGRAV